MVHQLEQKLKAAENAKTKLSGEVNVLIKDFEHSQTVIKEMTAKFQSSEKSNVDLSAKLKEMTNLYEKADMDRDNRKLAHEREELARAYKDADAGKQKALDRVALLEKELAKMKTEFEKKFGGARDEFETMKKKLVEEINVLTRKLTDSENRLKVEVEGIKKKMAITITELEMSLDASNKSNSQLQNTTKIQAQKIMELTAAYDDVNKKLGASVQQYDITIKRLTAIEAEFKSLTVTYNNTLKIVKDYGARWVDSTNKSQSLPLQITA